MNDRAKYKGRMAIYAMAGVYLLAQAYYMYKDIPTSSGTDKILMSIFMVVFAVIGAGMVIMGVTKSYKAIKEDYNAVPEEEKKEEEQQTLCARARYSDFDRGDGRACRRLAASRRNRLKRDDGARGCQNDGQFVFGHGCHRPQRKAV